MKSKAAWSAYIINGGHRLAIAYVPGADAEDARRRADKILRTSPNLRKLYREWLAAGRPVERHPAH